MPACLSDPDPDPDPDPVLRVLLCCANSTLGMMQSTNGWLDYLMGSNLGLNIIPEKAGQAAGRGETISRDSSPTNGGCSDDSISIAQWQGVADALHPVADAKEQRRISQSPSGGDSGGAKAAAARRVTC